MGSRVDDCDLKLTSKSPIVNLVAAKDSAGGKSGLITFCYWHGIIKR